MTIPDGPQGLQLHVVHTAQVPPDMLAGARTLMDAAFPGDFEEDDWEHALGGMHAVALLDGRVVGHAAVVQRRLLHAGRTWRTGYVEAVAVHPRWQRRGIGHRLMAAMEQVIRSAFELGALGATDASSGLYAQHGWQVWRGTLWCLGPQGTFRTAEEDGAVFVLPVAPGLDPAGSLTCDFRGGDVW